MKKYLRFIFPLLIVVLIVVLVISSKLGKKESGKDLYISFENESTSEEDKYIDGVYESVVKPNYKVETDDDGNKTIITDKEEISINEDDKEILIRNEEGDLEVIKVSDLLNGNNPTDKNTIPNESDIKINNCVPVTRTNHLGENFITYVPKEIAYDLDIVNRDGYYIGMLYGKYAYRFNATYVSVYNISKLEIIASYNRPILLGAGEAEYTEVWLSEGEIQIKGGI